eukprot:TRINITY_DN12309_c0_g1_i1.p1 TRINITY_DN12309_c0_g1~~TRINITY_DN12309_c0_g1_i1.p1  ORF type:complete len:228 (-),score=28.43 TRINITY_DN12309_c0_g1_i1:342-1025(-)
MSTQPYFASQSAEDGPTSDSSAPLLRGMLSDYEKGEKIGGGAFGTVWKVVRKSDQRPFALKSTQMSSRTENMELLLQLRHPNIVQYIEELPASNGQMFIMEFCERDLNFILRGRPNLRSVEAATLSWYKNCTLIACQLARALEYIHSRNILHRDIKPANILLNQDSQSGEWTAKLADFGLAKSVEVRAAQTRAGTMDYMAPEVHFREPYSSPADIFSLGCVFSDLFV